MKLKVLTGLVAFGDCEGESILCLSRFWGLLAILGIPWFAVVKTIVVGFGIHRKSAGPHLQMRVLDS